MKKFLSCIICIFFLVSLCAIVYSESVPAIEFADNSISIIQNKTAKLVPVTKNIDNPKKLKYTWESSDTSIATVNNGTVKGINAGEAIITCNTTLPDGNSLTASIKVTVIIPVKALTFSSKQEITLKSGSSQRIEYTITPDNASDKSIEWTSSDSSVISVDDNGVVTAKAAGKATVTGITRDGSNKKAQAKFYVPSMSNSTNSVYVRSVDGASFKFNYYGNDFFKDVTETQKGIDFAYTVSLIDNEVEVSIIPKTAGSGSLTFRDKKDPKSSFTVEVNITSDAIALNQYVLITNVTGNKNNFNVSYTNNSGADIAEYYFRIIPYNQFHEQIYYSNNVGEEQVYVGYEEVLKAGKSVKNRWYLGNTLKVEYIDVALNSIRLSNGKIIELSDNDLYWYSSYNNSYKGLPPSAKNSYPGDSIIDKAGSFKVGYTSTLIVKEQAKHFGYHHAGYYIEEVVTDSMSDKAGLKVKDLIIAVDGIPIADDVYGIENAKARIVNGGSFTVTIERYAQDGTFDLVFTK